MTFTPTSLEGSYLIDPNVFQDERGWFTRTYCKEEFSSIVPSLEWVQFNHSCTRHCGAIRGLHFQKPPHQEAKLIRCIAGAVWDVTVDLRIESPSFLKWFGVELSAANRKMLFVPERFAHGFQTLTENCEMLYHHTHAYAPDAEGGLRYDDPQLAIHWPKPPTCLSERDLRHPLLTQDFKGI